jgi:membrane-bound ClpP family serine protease
LIYPTDTLKIGDKGNTISRLNPIGNIRVNDQKFEASSIGDFIDANTPIEITNIEGNKVTVKPV